MCRISLAWQRTKIKSNSPEILRIESHSRNAFLSSGTIHVCILLLHFVSLEYRLSAIQNCWRSGSLHHTMKPSTEAERAVTAQLFPALHRVTDVRRKFQSEFKRRTPSRHTILKWIERFMRSGRMTDKKTQLQSSSSHGRHDQRCPRGLRLRRQEGPHTLPKCCQGTSGDP